MTIKEARQESINNGWDPTLEDCLYDLHKAGRPCPFGVHYPRQERMLLDPLFWQALGRRLGWQEYDTEQGGRYTEAGWKEQWHRFITHLISGKDAESFFETL